MPPKHRQSAKTSTFRHDPPRVVLFASVSSEQQATEDKISIPDQLESLRKAVNARGWTVHDEIIVPGFSRSFFTYQEFCDAAAAENINDPQKMWNYWGERSQEIDIIACINASRIGREQSIVDEFIGRTYHAGLFVFTLKNGLVEPEQRRTVFMIEGYGAATEVTEFTRRRSMGMRKRAELGFHVGMRAIPYFHRYTFENGIEIKTPGADGTLYYLTVDRTYQRLFDDLYDLIVNEHTHYDSLETAIFNRGHLDPLGRRYPYTFFREKMWQPAFHGAMGFGGMGRRERWRIDPAYAAQIPPDVSVFYGVVEPVYIGEKGTQFRNELYRRQEIVGKARPQNLTRFSGLAVCCDCGYPLARSMSGDRKYEYYRCVTNTLGRTHQRRVTTCSQHHGVRADVLQAYIDSWLHLFHAEPTAEFVAEIYAQDSQPAPRLDAELAAAIERRDVLIERMADPRMPPAALSAAYRNLESISDQIASLERQLVASEQTEALANNHLVIAHAALSELDIDALWTLDDTTINHFLHRVIDPLRIEVQDGKPTRFVTR